VQQRPQSQAAKLLVDFAAKIKGRVTPQEARNEPDGHFVNSLGMEFVPVPITGKSAGKPVLFSVWETRVKDFQGYVKSLKKRGWSAAPSPPDHPAGSVTAEEAAGFCVWLTQTEKKTTPALAGWKYRLPTDHEWSCAVALDEDEKLVLGNFVESSNKPAGKLNSTEYPWGTWPPREGSANVFHLTHKEAAMPVGSFPPNRYGLYDLAGNVMEWAEEQRIPTTIKFVLRGGSFAKTFDDEEGGKVRLLSSRRFPPQDAKVITDRGFRCVLVKE
jgi:formylglycine-generating enzyme required for sulfatase activity